MNVQDIYNTQLVQNDKNYIIYHMTLQCTFLHVTSRGLFNKTLFVVVIWRWKQGQLCDKSKHIISITCCSVSKISERALATLKHLHIGDLSLNIACQIEEAQHYWSCGEQNTAKYLIRTAIEQLKKVNISSELP